MPTISYTAKCFGPHWGPALVGRHFLAISWNEVVWAAMTMGKPGIAFLLSHDWHSVSDLIVRSHTVYANLRDQSGHFVKSSLYEGLDPTEKGGISYFMGMMAAKVLGARLLDTPWLFHLSMIEALGGSVSLMGQSQPDLVGLRSGGDWIIVEAKGRTRGYSATAMSTAKKQTRQLRKINGQFPSLRVAVQASFNPRLEWVIEDPEEFDEDAIDLEFDTGTAIDMYYSASMAATEDGELRRVRNREFIVRELPDIGVIVGLDREIGKRVQMGETPLPVRSTLIDRRPPYTDDGFVVFADGVAISLDERWSDERMRRDPLDRRKD